VSPADSPLVGQSKAAPGIGARPYRVTTPSGPSRPTTPTDNSVGMTKAYNIDCGNGRRLDPYQGADRGLRPGSALHVPASPTGRLVERPGPTYQRTPGVGTKDKDEPWGQPVIHGQPLPPRGLQSPLLWQQGTTILPVRPHERTGQNIIMIWPESPPSRRSSRARC
jgi:hypothetical protein